jgi:hypothetical protein
MTGERACSGDSIGKRSEAARIFERIARRNQPPDTIELETLEREKRRRKMGLMRWIERSTEQSDPHAGRMRG